MADNTRPNVGNQSSQSNQSRQSNQSNQSNPILTRIIQHTMVRIPHLNPKRKLNQRTIGRDPEFNRQYTGLNKGFRNHPERLQPLLTDLRGRIRTDNDVLSGDEGIYTWILKRGHLHATKLMSNQEIGSLHTNIDGLTMLTNNIQYVNRNTMKNRRKPHETPVLSAGELLLVRDLGSNQQGSNRKGVRLYFNLQSGTYSEVILKHRAKERGLQLGYNTKTIRAKMNELMIEFRDEMVEQVRAEMSRTTGLSLDRIRFLSCDEEIQRELEEIPLLRGVYEHGSCHDEDDYHESMAGRNLIRRFTAFTSIANRNLFNLYFTEDPVEPVLGKRTGPNTKNNTRKNKSAKHR